MWHRRYILLSVVMVRDMNLPIPNYIRILWQDKKHYISDVGCSFLQIWLNPNQTALKGFHQIASLRTHKQPCLGIRKPWSKFWVWGEIQLARILLLISILNVAIFCVDSSLSQDWKVGEHLCWNFPIFSEVIVVFGVQCWRLIHPDDVPQNWQQEGAEEKQKLLCMNCNIKKSGPKKVPTIFLLEEQTSHLDQGIGLFVCGLQPTRIALWASIGRSSSQARVTSVNSSSCLMSIRGPN